MRRAVTEVLPATQYSAGAQWPSGTVPDLQIPPTSAVYQHQLVPFLRGRLMSTSESWE